MQTTNNKCVFLDRDGTIIEDISYCNDVGKLALKPDAVTSLKKLQNAGCLLGIITNQSGVARGYFTEETVVNFNDALVNILKENGVIISGVYYCPHYEKGAVEKYAIKCNCRKPKLDMFLSATKKFNVNLSKSYAVGDKPRDLCICKDNGCKGFLISANGLSDYNEEDKAYYLSKGDCVSVVKSLTEVAAKILGE